ncbi:ALP1-like protein isoform X1, partial [Tanacetum coccineum]
SFSSIDPHALDENYLQMALKTSRDAFKKNWMLGNINCTGSSWVNCSNAYRAQYRMGDHGSHPFILSELVASQDLWISHALFGVSVANRDVIVIHQSSILNDLKDEKA